MIKRALFIAVLLIFAVTAFGHYPRINRIIPPPIVRWSMDDDTDSNVVIDSMEYSNGIFVGNDANTLAHSVLGIANRALSLNDTNDHIDTNSTFESIFQSQGSDGVTVSLWLEPNDGRPSNIQLAFGVDIGEPVGRFFEFGIKTNGHIWAAYYVNTEQNEILDVTSEFQFSEGINSWAMLSVVVEKLSATTAKLSLYVNGDLDITQSGNATMANFATTYNPYIGATNLGGSLIYPMCGLIDEAMIFDYALTPEQVSLLYTAGRRTDKF